MHTSHAAPLISTHGGVGAGAPLSAQVTVHFRGAASLTQVTNFLGWSVLRAQPLATPRPGTSPAPAPCPSEPCHRSGSRPLGPKEHQGGLATWEVN